MLAPQHRPKRARSSSPVSEPIDINSPLDVLIKRRRRDHLFDLDMDEPQWIPSASSSSSVEPGVERRRAKQWERLNAPPSSSQFFSQPLPPPISPAPRWQTQSQPTPVRPLMSSSPVRHHPPSSSPFRSAGSSETKAPTHVDEWLDPDEMRREWGEEYAAQNSVLHSLVSVPQPL